MDQSFSTIPPKLSLPAVCDLAELYQIKTRRLNGLYPFSEATNNTTNFGAALQRQFGTDKDDLNNELWINK